jgi:hypothetical protein
MVSDVGQNVILSEAKEPKHCHGPYAPLRVDKRDPLCLRQDRVGMPDLVGGQRRPVLCRDE